MNKKSPSLPHLLSQESSTKSKFHENICQRIVFSSSDAFGTKRTIEGYESTTPTKLKRRVLHICSTSFQNPLPLVNAYTRKNFSGLYIHNSQDVRDYKKKSSIIHNSTIIFARLVRCRQSSIYMQ